jgi:hypothetical protein
MKIIHSSGKELDLPPDTVLSMSRTNPFFNKYGEQSLPVKLPASDNNRLTLGFPGSMAATHKMPQRNNATIQEGVFSAQCRQAILSAGENEIDTSYYLGTGSFYEKMKDLTLSTVFKDKALDFASVAAAVAFCRSLYVTPDKRFACFPVVVESQDTGKTVTLNATSTPAKADGYYPLYNETDRTEEVDGNTIRLSAGFYITPFIKALHLLTETFRYMGYEPEESFLSEREPFASMVFLNANIDTIVNGRIRYAQIVPDCTVSALLDIFRVKFCCEFLPDETNKKVRIELFNELLDSAPYSDLTAMLTKKPVINHGAVYKQLRLTSDRGAILTVQSGADGAPETVPSTPDCLSKTPHEVAALYPDAIVDRALGYIYREGFAADNAVRSMVGSLQSDYMAQEEEGLEAEKKESPDTLVHIGAFGGTRWIAPFAGASRSLNSTIVLDNEPRGGGADADTAQKKTELKAMLCFTAHTAGRRCDMGTVYAHDLGGERLWDYALCYNGPDGLYEKFWRRYDGMLRNAFRPVTTEALLPDTVKINLPPHRKVLLQGQEVLPNIIKYHIGKKKESECTFLTIRLQEPLSMAPAESGIFGNYPFRWEVKLLRSDGGTHNWMQLKETPETFFPPPPTAAQYMAGGEWHKKTFACNYAFEITYILGRKALTNPVPGTITVWLEARAR